MVINERAPIQVIKRLQGATKRYVYASEDRFGHEVVPLQRMHEQTNLCASSHSNDYCLWARLKAGKRQGYDSRL